MRRPIALLVLLAAAAMEIGLPLLGGEGRGEGEHFGSPKISSLEPADQPAPRTDVNSQLAHTRLLDKARKGGIDIYFEGDSITRRLGNQRSSV